MRAREMGRIPAAEGRLFPLARSGSPERVALFTSLGRSYTNNLGRCAVFTSGNVTVYEARGVKFRGPIHEDEAGSFAFLEDPDGNPIYLAELKWGQVGEGQGQSQNAR
jgi:hypothetical protein